MTKCLKCGVDNPPNTTFCENCGKPLAAAGGPALETMSALHTIGGGETLPTHRNKTDENLKLEPGTVFADRYTIVSQIGIGGMGVVYRATDRIGNRDVALKLIRSDRLGGGGAVDKLISEGVLTQDIRHKNVVAVYHVDQVDGLPFIAMEYVNGVSLREWHRKQVNARVDVPMIVAGRIVNEVLHGLQAAHDMGIIHRDLKPENIMLTAEPTAEATPLKLLDFGIARVAGKPAESGTGTGLGTPRYMAPEQITNPDSAGPAADFYSLSTIFYELLVDVLPHGGWQPPSSGRADVPPGIDALIQSGLQNRPSSRPQSVAEYRQKLNAAMPGLPGVGPGPRPPLPVYDNGGPPNQGKWLKIGGGIAAGVIALAAIGSMLQPGPNGGDLPPPPVNYALLNGQWTDDIGGTLNVNIDSSGRFSGRGLTADNVSVQIEGSFSGLSATYNIAGGPYVFPGDLSWDGRDSHLNFQTKMPDGTVNMRGRFHINHPPTQ